MSAAGRMPWASSRSSAVARSACHSASSTSATSRPEASSSPALASLSVITVWTSRCCAPSCRSRWIRRRAGVGGRDDPGARRGQLGAALGVPDRQRDEPGELCQAILRSRGQRLAPRHGTDAAPRPGFHHDRRPGRRAQADRARDRGCGARDGAVAVQPRRATGAQDPRGRCPSPSAGTQMPTLAMPPAPRRRWRRPTGRSAAARSGTSQHPRRLDRDGGEHRLGLDAARDQLGDAPQRGLLVGQRPQLRARLRVRDRRGHELGEAGDPRLGVTRRRFPPVPRREDHAPHAPVDGDRDAHRGTDAAAPGLLDERSAGGSSDGPNRAGCRPSRSARNTAPTGRRAPTGGVEIPAGPGGDERHGVVGLEPQHRGRLGADEPGDLRVDRPEQLVLRHAAGDQRSPRVAARPAPRPTADRRAREPRPGPEAVARRATFLECPEHCEHSHPPTRQSDWPVVIDPPRRSSPGTLLGRRSECETLDRLLDGGPRG